MGTGRTCENPAPRASSLSRLGGSPRVPSPAPPLASDTGRQYARLDPYSTVPSGPALPSGFSAQLISTHTYRPVGSSASWLARKIPRGSAESRITSKVVMTSDRLGYWAVCGHGLGHGPPAGDQNLASRARFSGGRPIPRSEEETMAWPVAHQPFEQRQHATRCHRRTTPTSRWSRTYTPPMPTATRNRPRRVRHQSIPFARPSASRSNTIAARAPSARPSPGPWRGRAQRSVRTGGLD